MNDTQNKLLYVWDAYCGWCYGFSNSLKAFHENHPELPLTVLPGGLFMGEKKVPIASFPHIPGANQRIGQLTGAQFGKPYEDLLQKGTFIMDSEAAAKGFFALQSFAPERAYYIAASMQRAFYYEGKSLSDHATYRELAIEHGMDPIQVIERYESSISTEEAHASFARVQQMGVNSYPTLLLQKGEELIVLGGGVMTAEKIEARLKEVL